MPRTETVRAIRPPQTPAPPEPAVLPAANRDADYVVPVLQMRLSEKWVDGAFWLSLGGAALFGAIDPPLALLVGAGVVVARHQVRR